MIIYKNGPIGVKASCATDVLKSISSSAELNDELNKLQAYSVILIENIFHLLSIGQQMKILDTCVDKKLEMYIFSVFETPASHVHYETPRFFQETDSGNIIGCSYNINHKFSSFSTKGFIWNIESLRKYIFTEKGLLSEIYIDFNPVAPGCERLIKISS